VGRDGGREVASTSMLAWDTHEEDAPSAEDERDAPAL
jgi:hypothetical protein